MNKIASKSLKDLVKYFISTKREEGYWDFKEEPHSNNADLLHDILCMANNLHKGDKYLIIGVSDHSAGCKIIGLKKDTPNRKTQAMIIDFLGSKKFCADIRPEIDLRTVIINKKEIDVIIIKNTTNKPYFITEDYRDKDKLVRAFYIYTRIGDTNTHIDKSADIYHVEKMWKERFGLDLTPADKFKQLLTEPKEWFFDKNNKNYAYHLQHPEFKIEFGKTHEIDNSNEAYLHFYLANNGHIGTAYFKYYTTPLFDLEYIYCDNFGIMLPIPQKIRIESSNNWFYYYNLEDIYGLFLIFLRGKKPSFETRGLSMLVPFIVFQTTEEMNCFCSYLENNADIIKNTQIDTRHIPKSYTHKKEAEFLLKIKKIFDSRK